MSDLIDRQAAIDALKNRWRKTRNYEGIGDDIAEECELYLKQLPSAQPEIDKDFGECEDDLISRQAAIEALEESKRIYVDRRVIIGKMQDIVSNLPSAQPDPEKYEYHYDHTDCIWYRPEARNRCPVTCAQYRDGWNDAMNYIFRDGKGYMPYRRDEKYEG